MHNHITRPVSEYLCVCVHVRKWALEADLEWRSFEDTLFVLGQGLSVAWDTQIRPAWLASEPQGPTPPPPPPHRARVTSMCLHAVVTRPPAGSGVELSASL